MAENFSNPKNSGNFAKKSSLTICQHRKKGWPNFKPSKIGRAFITLEIVSVTQFGSNLIDSLLEIKMVAKQKS